MAPKRGKRKNAAVKNNSTITKFFAISSQPSDTPGPPTRRIGLPRSDSATPSLELNAAGADTDVDVDETPVATACPKPALLEPLSPIAVIDSGSDSDDGLVDADSILGVKSTFKPPAMTIRQRAKHRNTLKELVRESETRKYNYSFLEQHALEAASGSQSDSDDGGGLRECASDDGGFARDVLGDDMARIRLQMGRLGERGLRQRSAAQIAVFGGLSRGAQSLDMRMAIPRLARLHAAGGRWMSAATGDELVRGMCYARDRQVAAECYAALKYALGMRVSEWALEPNAFYTLLVRLVGTPLDGGADIGAPDTAGSTPPVYVEIVRTLPSIEQEMRSNVERAAWLLDIACRAVGAVETDDYAQIAALYVYCLADHRVSPAAVSIRKSLATFVRGIQPASRWAQVLSQCVTRVVRCFASTTLRAQLQVVESLPTACQRCVQLRQSLALAFLSAQVDGTGSGGDVAMDAHPVLAAAGLVADGLLAMNATPDFELLETRVCLLGCVLAGVAVLREQPDATKAVRGQLAVLNRRICDSITDGMAKTLAKDAVQILLSRIDMITSSTSAHHQTNIIYGSNKTPVTTTTTSTTALRRHLQTTKLL